MAFKANSKEDVQRLAALIRADGSWQLAADLNILRLMFFSEPIIQHLINQKLEEGDLSMVRDFFRLTWELDKTIIEQFIANSALHLENGIDIEDTDSVGGWSQREIDLLANNQGWE